MPTRFPGLHPALRKWLTFLPFALLGLSAFTEAQALIITTQPQGQTNNEGQPFVFSVAVQGAEPFSFQWVKDGQTIPDATNDTYSISASTVSDAGLYSV